MIYKSYLLEENFNLQKNNLALFYGENLGLINDFKEKIKKKTNTIIKFTQDQILKDESITLILIFYLEYLQKEKLYFHLYEAVFLQLS